MRTRAIRGRKSKSKPRRTQHKRGGSGKLLVLSNSTDPSWAIAVQQHQVSLTRPRTKGEKEILYGGLLPSQKRAKEAREKKAAGRPAARDLDGRRRHSHDGAEWHHTDAAEVTRRNHEYDYGADPKAK